MKAGNVIVVDTSSWIEYFKDGGSTSHNPVFDLIDSALAEARVYLPPLVVAELLSGKIKASMREKLLDFLQELPLCYSGFDHWERVGLLRSRLSEKGIQTSTPDTHIAQAAIDLDAVLLSEDKIFQKISRHSRLKLLSDLK